MIRYFTKRIFSLLSNIPFGKENEKRKIEEIKKSKNIAINNQGIGNKIEILDENFNGRINISILGNNNTILIPKTFNIKGTLNIQLFGNSSEIKMENIYIGQHLNLVLGQNFLTSKVPEKMKIILGNNFCVESAQIENLHSNTSTVFGENCMLSSDIWISNSDHHPIYNTEHEIINKANGLNVGKHVWIGRGSMILKNLSIPDNCIVGAGSVVTKSFSEENCIYAGNPAKLIKKKITWDYRSEDFV